MQKKKKAAKKAKKTKPKKRNIVKKKKKAARKAQPKKKAAKKKAAKKKVAKKKPAAKPAAKAAPAPAKAPAAMNKKPAPLPGSIGAKAVGRVVHYYDRIGVAIVTLSKTLKVGDKVLFTRGQREFRQTIRSLQMHHEPVKSAGPGDVAGIKVDKVAPEGMWLLPV